MKNTIASGFIIAACGLAWAVGCEQPSQEPLGAQGVADAAVGKAIYRDYCNQCHPLDDGKKNSDTLNLKRHRRKITTKFIAEHMETKLSQADVDNLRAFAAQQ